jgi:hypothetical protein
MVRFKVRVSNASLCVQQAHAASIASFRLLGGISLVKS